MAIEDELGAYEGRGFLYLREKEEAHCRLYDGSLNVTDIPPRIRFPNQAVGSCENVKAHPEGEGNFNAISEGDITAAKEYLGLVEKLSPQEIRKRFYVARGRPFTCLDVGRFAV